MASCPSYLWTQTYRLTKHLLAIKVADALISTIEAGRNAFGSQLMSMRGLFDRMDTNKVHLMPQELSHCLAVALRVIFLMLVVITVQVGWAHLNG